MQREIEAIERIERAVARLEQAAGASGAGTAAELERVRAAHEQLRDRVRGAIGEIDALLAARPRADG